MLTFLVSFFGVIRSKLKVEFFFLLFLMFIGTILELFGIALIVPVLYTIVEEDIVAKYPLISPAMEFFDNPSGVLLILYAIIFLSFIYLIKLIFLTFLNWKQIRFIYDCEAYLSNKLFSIYLNAPYDFHLKNNSTTLLRNVTSEVSLFSSSITAFTTLIIEIFILIGVVFLLIIYDPLTSGSVIIFIFVISIIFYILTRKKLKEWGIKRQYEEGLKLKYISQGFGAVKDIKIYHKEKNFTDYFKSSNNKILDIGALQRFISVLPRLWLEFIAASSLIIFILIFWMQDRPFNELIPTIGLFLGASFRVMPSFNKVVGGLQHLKFSLPAILLVEKEFNILSVKQKRFSKKQMNLSFRNNLEIYNLSYGYQQDGKKVLNNINLKIKFGERVGFIGESGAGKTSLINLIMGLLSPSDGEIKVDGNNIKQNIFYWQNMIGFVPQNIYLTDDTLLNNIAFGEEKENIDMRKVNNAIDAANLRNLVSELSLGVNTTVGERGVRLSGGQQQRIGIARALYREPKVLILDEATSSLDNKNEDSIIEDIKKLNDKVTIIMIAHRISTLNICDNIYEITNNGNLLKKDNKL